MSVERTEFQLVIEQRTDGYANRDKRPYRTTRHDKRDLAHVVKGLFDWEERKAEVLLSGATFMRNWTAYIETREVTETPWERVEA